MRIYTIEIEKKASSSDCYVSKSGTVVDVRYYASYASAVLYLIERGYINQLDLDVANNTRGRFVRPANPDMQILGEGWGAEDVAAVSYITLQDMRTVSDVPSLQAEMMAQMEIK